jgi:hypothetical protein
MLRAEVEARPTKARQAASPPVRAIGCKPYCLAHAGQGRMNYFGNNRNTLISPFRKAAAYYG